MAKKLDLSKIKELLRTKGERVGLGVALAIGGLILIIGVASGLTARSKDWAEDFNKKAAEVERLIGSGVPPDKKIGAKPPDEWGADRFGGPSNSLFATNVDVKARRRMPKVVVTTHQADTSTPKSTAQGVTVVADNQEIQVDFLRVGVRAYDVNAQNEIRAIAAADKNAKGRPVEQLVPLNLIVVNAVYDYREQLREFADAQNMSVEDLLRKKDDGLLPRIIGIDVIRYRKAPGAKDFDMEADGKTPRGTKIYEFLPSAYEPEKEGKPEFKIPVRVVAAKGERMEKGNLDLLFRNGVFDKELTAQLGQHLQIASANQVLLAGMTSPLPELVTGHRYPKLQLQGITSFKHRDLIAEAAGDNPPAMQEGGPKGIKIRQDPRQPPPPGPGDKDDGIKPKFIAWERALDNDGIERLLGKYHPLEPFGSVTATKVDIAKPADPRAFDPRKVVDPKKDPKEDVNVNPDPRLIRFVDVIDDRVEPGTSFAYTFQVHLANPYFGRKDVEAPDWAKKTLLPPGPVTLTPHVTVPPTYYYYAVNLVGPTDKEFKDSGEDRRVFSTGVDKGNDKGDLDASRVAVHVQQWLGIGGDSPIGDWVIAERLLLRRGDPIGRRLILTREKGDNLNTVMTEIPVWDLARGKFLPSTTWELDPRDKEKDPQKKKKIFKGGAPMDFQALVPPPILVDFEGGKRGAVNSFGTNKNEIEVHFEMLILDENNRLVVRNSAADTVDPGRIARHKHWRERVSFFRGSGDPKGGGGPTDRPKGLKGG